MFQNIAEEVIYTNEEETSSKVKNIFKTLFSIKDIILYIVSFGVSVVGFGGEIAPFGLAMLAAVCSNKIPMAIVFVLTSIGTFIGFGKETFLIYILTSLIFIASILIKTPKTESHSRNEQKKLGANLLFSVTVVQAIKIIFTDFYVYNLLTSFVLIISAYVFYKIFANSIIVIKEHSKVFTIEEVIGASLLVAIAVCSLGNLSIFELSIKNILSIMLVLFLGWKKGMLVGSTAGITIGVVLGIIGATNPILIAAYAVSRYVGRNIK